MPDRRGEGARRKTAGMQGLARSLAANGPRTIDTEPSVSAR